MLELPLSDGSRLSGGIDFGRKAVVIVQKPAEGGPGSTLSIPLTDLKALVNLVRTVVKFLA